MPMNKFRARPPLSGPCTSEATFPCLSHHQTGCQATAIAQSPQELFELAGGLSWPKPFPFCPLSPASSFASWHQGGGSACQPHKNSGAESVWHLLSAPVGVISVSSPFQSSHWGSKGEWGGTLGSPRVREGEGRKRHAPTSFGDLLH